MKGNILATCNKLQCKCKLKVLLFLSRKISRTSSSILARAPRISGQFNQEDDPNAWDATSDGVSASSQQRALEDLKFPLWQ